MGIISLILIHITPALGRHFVNAVSLLVTVLALAFPLNLSIVLSLSLFFLPIAVNSSTVMKKNDGISAASPLIDKTSNENLIQPCRL